MVSLALVLNADPVVPVISSDIVGPDLVCAQGTLNLTPPTYSSATTTGWQISPYYDFSIWGEYNGEEVDFSYNLWFIRFYAANGTDVVYSNVDTVFVSTNPVIEDFSAPDAVCAGESFTLPVPTVTLNHPSSTFNAHWEISSTETGTFSEFTNTDITYGINGYYLRYVVTNDCDLTGYSDPVQIFVYDVPYFNDSLTAPQAICFGESYDLPELDVDWRHDIDGTTQWEVCATEDGTYEPFVNDEITMQYNGYYLRLAATNGCGTTVSNSVVLVVDTVPNIGVLQQIPDICAGEPLSLYYYTPTINNSDTTGWQLSQDASFTNPSGYYNMLLGPEYDGWYLRFFGHSDCGTNYSNVIQIGVNPLPEVTLSGVTELCAGESTTLTAEPDTYASYDWYNAGTWLGSGATFNTGELQYGASYICVTATEDGCISRDTIRVTVHQYPNFAITSSTGSFDFINGDDVTLSVPAGYSEYSWYKSDEPGEILSTTNELLLEDLQHTASYCCEVVSNNMCPTTACVTLHVDRIHSITVAEGIVNGTLTAPEEGIAGQMVQVVATPDEGYLLTALRYYFDDPNVSYAIDLVSQQFIMPDDDIIVTATFSLPLLGDANTDGEVNILDILTTLNYILDKDPLPFSFVNADVNVDGIIDIADVLGINAIILSLRGDCGDYTALYEVVDGQLMVYSPVALSGVQAELTSEPLVSNLPEGFVTLGGWVDGRYIFLAYNLSGEMAAGIQSLMTLSEGTEVVGLTMATKEGCSVKGEAGTLGVGETDSACQVFPNPTDGKITVLCQGLTKVSIVSMTGQVLYNEEYTVDQADVDLSGFADGIYMLVIRTQDQTIIRKISKK